MWRSRIRLRRTSVFSYLTGSLLCFWCCVLLVFFSFSLPLSLGRHQLSNAVISPSETPKREGKLSLFLSFWVHCILVGQSVCLSLLGRSPICHLGQSWTVDGKKREGERERARLISLSLSILLSLFPFSLYLSLYILVVWVIFSSLSIAGACSFFSC